MKISTENNGDGEVKGDNGSNENEITIEEQSTRSQSVSRAGNHLPVGLESPTC
jgi:hypothetical protein